MTYRSSGEWTLHPKSPILISPSLPDRLELVTREQTRERLTQKEILRLNVAVYHTVLVQIRQTCSDLSDVLTTVSVFLTFVVRSWVVVLTLLLRLSEKRPALASCLYTSPSPAYSIIKKTRVSSWNQPYRRMMFRCLASQEDAG